MISDLVCLAITWYHSRGHLKTVRGLGHHDTSLASLLMRNGYLYFAVMLILNVTDIVMWLYQYYVEVITVSMNPISSILISRCLLDLRNAIDNHDDDIDVSDISFELPTSYDTSFVVSPHTTDNPERDGQSSPFQMPSTTE